MRFGGDEPRISYYPCTVTSTCVATRKCKHRQNFRSEGGGLGGPERSLYRAPEPRAPETLPSTNVNFVDGMGARERRIPTKH